MSRYIHTLLHTSLVLLLAACPATPADTDTGPAATTGSSSTTTTDPSSTGTTTTGAPEPTTSTGFIESSSSSAGSGSFVGDQDLCAAPFGEYEVRCSYECDVWTQDCPSGQKCVPYSGDGDSVWESKKCVPIDPDPDQVGEPCTVEGSSISGIDSCEIGAICWHVDDVTLEGTCVGFCDGTPEAPTCPQDHACLISNQGVLILCLPTCDPLLQNCPDGDLCISNQSENNSFICVPDLSGDAGQAFDPCDVVNSCDPGLFCADHEVATECDPEAFTCCTPFCDLGAPNTCPGAMQACQPWYPPGTAPAGLDDLGYCTLP